MASFDYDVAIIGIDPTACPEARPHEYIASDRPQMDRCS